MKRGAALTRYRELSAERMRRTRERRRRGQYALRGVVGDDTLGDRLVSAGLLPVADESNYAKIAEVVSTLLQVISPVDLVHVARNSGAFENLPSSGDANSTPHQTGAHRVR